MTLTLPHLNFLLICEKYFQDEQGVLTFHDVLRHIIYTGADETPRPFTVNPVAVVSIYGEDESAKYEFSLAVGTPNGQEMVMGRFTSGFYGGAYRPTQILPLTVTVTPGVFWFKLYQESRLMGQYALQVSFQQEIVQ